MTENSDPEPLTLVINGQAITADMETWRSVQQQILDRLVSDRRAWENEQRAAGQVWSALYWRHHRLYEDEYFSLEDARACIEAGEDNGDLSGAAIRLPFGLLVSPRDLMELPPDTMQEIERELAKQRARAAS